jgi:hypothetical protein
LTVIVPLGPAVMLLYAVVPAGREKLPLLASSAPEMLME